MSGRREPIGAMMVIWKIELTITDIQIVLMPLGAEILSVASQNGSVCLWAVVNQGLPQLLKQRVIEIIGTGNPVPSGVDIERQFIGTVVANPFVWHVFERR